LRCWRQILLGYGPLRRAPRKKRWLTSPAAPICDCGAGRGAMPPSPQRGPGNPWAGVSCRQPVTPCCSRELGVAAGRQPAANRFPVNRSCDRSRTGGGGAWGTTPMVFWSTNRPSPRGPSKTAWCKAAAGRPLRRATPRGNSPLPRSIYSALLPTGCAAPVWSPWAPAQGQPGDRSPAVAPGFGPTWATSNSSRLELPPARVLKVKKKRLERLGSRPRALWSMAHPAYVLASNRWELAAAAGVPLLPVQHHHAICLASGGRARSSSHQSCWGWPGWTLARRRRQPLGG